MFGNFAFGAGYFGQGTGDGIIVPPAVFPSGTGPTTMESPDAVHRSVMAAATTFRTQSHTRKRRTVTFEG